jgi:hypothetical protein
LDQVNTCQTLPRVLSMSRTFQPHNSAFIAVATSKPLARDVATSPRATNPTSVRYTIWAIDPPVVPLISE